MIVTKPSEGKIINYINEHRATSQSDFIILCGEDAPLDYPLLIQMLNDKNVNFCGGIFPSVIYNSNNYKDGVLVLPILFEQNPTVIKGLDNGQIDIPETLKPQDANSLFILTDGLSNWISKFIFQLYYEIGSDHYVFGSGAGFGSFKREPCLFTNEGIFMDAAMVVPVKNQIVQSSRHGLNSIAGPYIATKTSANLIQELNWKPAYPIYKSIIEDQEDIDIKPDNFYKYAKSYPFGIYRTDSEYLVRDPVRLQSDNSIKFGAEIPSNSILYLMKANVPNMLTAGEEACNKVISNTENPSFLFIANCISRTWILNDSMSQELRNIEWAASRKSLPVYGVFSMGEISSANGGLLDYHHKTIVISIIEKGE